VSVAIFLGELRALLTPIPKSKAICINLSSSHAACLLSVKVPGKTMALIVSVEVDGVVLVCVLMSRQAVLTAADLAKPAWVVVLPAEENICVIPEDVKVFF
jgi:hypothetical protein